MISVLKLNLLNIEISFGRDDPGTNVPVYSCNIVISELQFEISAGAIMNVEYQPYFR